MEVEDNTLIFAVLLPVLQGFSIAVLVIATQQYMSSTGTILACEALLGLSSLDIHIDLAQVVVARLVVTQAPQAAACPHNDGAPV